MKFLELKYIIKGIQDQHVKMQSNFNHIRKDAGYLDKEEMKQKLIKDIKKR